MLGGLACCCLPVRGPPFFFGDPVSVPIVSRWAARTWARETGDAPQGGLLARIARAWARATSDVAPIACPEWLGEKPPAQILVVQQPGTSSRGDVIAMVRYLPLLRRLGYGVGFRCLHRGLGRLLDYSFANDPLVPEFSYELGQVVPLQEASYHVDMMHLPDYFSGGALRGRRTGKCKLYVPAAPYLRADPDRVAHYKSLLPPNTIGLCWASGFHPAGGVVDPRVKSMALADMAPIYERFPCASLQVGRDRTQIAGTPVLDVLPANPDWFETAALVKACRCVVAVDTGVAHLAGALGVPLHLALHPEPQLYWSIAGYGDFPWYKGVRVYRSRGDWAPVIPRIAAALGPPQEKACPGPVGDGPGTS